MSAAPGAPIEAVARVSELWMRTAGTGAMIGAALRLANTAAKRDGLEPGHQLRARSSARIFRPMSRKYFAFSHA